MSPKKPKKCYKCHKCHKEFQSKYSLERHLSESHRIGAFTLYGCNECDYKAKRRSDLAKHRQRRHPYSQPSNPGRKRQRFATAIDPQTQCDMIAEMIQHTLKKQKRMIVISSDDEPDTTQDRTLTSTTSVSPTPTTTDTPLMDEHQPDATPTQD